MNLLGNPNSQSLSELRDPFFTRNLTQVMLMWRVASWSDKPLVYAKVEFQSGNTTGVQEIKAESFDELINKTRAFLETLKATKQ